LDAAGWDTDESWSDECHAKRTPGRACETVSEALAIHTEVIPVPLGGDAYVLPMVCALDGTVSSHPLNATGYVPNNAFLFLEEGHALLLRAGFTVHQRALITALNDLLPAECEVSIGNVEVGEFAMLNFACSVGHEVRVGASSVVNPGVNLSGGVVVGERVLVGAGAVVLQYLSIGDGATIGAGAVVTHDVAPGVTVVGVPARPLVRPGVAD